MNTNNRGELPAGRSFSLFGRRSFCGALLASVVFWFIKKSAALAHHSREGTPASANHDPQPIVSLGGDVPLVRIDLIEGTSEAYRTKVGEIVYQTLVDVLKVPEHDHFHVITEHPKGGLPFDRNYLGIHRSDACIFFQITLLSGRSVELKQSFYKTLVDRLHEEVKLRKEDAFINLVEVPKENWSFGNGEAQYVTTVS
ncbi:tautomerase family protein [Granulicella sp. L60]|uniref:tautomerase family protein n=1 Tax=Granulicella sp. L60 TaxID=1641866 RepID=UPI0020B11767|nr:tautomerase family protein [Granulicella sp. L60]